MRTAEMFVLNVEPETTAMPVRVSIALTGAVPDCHGVLHVTPNCMSLDELEGYINALQDGLDVIRWEARSTAQQAGATAPTLVPTPLQQQGLGYAAVFVFILLIAGWRGLGRQTLKLSSRGNGPVGLDMSCAKAARPVTI